MSTTRQKRVSYRDEDVRRNVSQFLGSRHFPSFRSFKIEVEKGAVTLSGSVCSFHEKQVAITSCQRVAGVVSLVDRIKVVDGLATC